MADKYQDPTFDPDDHENRQDEADRGLILGDGGIIESVLDKGFNGAGRSEMYREWTVPGMFPHERQPVLSNWSDEDKEMYCGIYTDARKAEIRENIV